MLFRMIRTQTGEDGTLRAGVTYDAGKSAKIEKVAKDFIKAGFAEEVSADQLKKEKVTAEKLAAASAPPVAVTKDASALKAARAAEANAKADADAARKAEAVAIEEAKALADRVAELEAELASKGAEQAQK